MSYEAMFRKSVNLMLRRHDEYDILHSTKLRIIFKDIITRLFVKKHSDIKVITNNKDLKKLLSEKIWEEFYDIAKNKGIEIATNIIFKRYEK